MKPRHSSTPGIHPEASAKSAGLRYVTDVAAGIRRIKAGSGFRYIDPSGRTVNDEETLRRIRSLVIPPAWKDVWVCPFPGGHLQATGRDARGRKQHRYHPLWREVRDSTKYDRMISFAKAVPRIRSAVARDLEGKGLTRRRVLATVVRLMDLTFIRVGNEEYARTNNSFGLTTLKDKHAKVNGKRVAFSFRGKSGKVHNIELEDRRLAKIVKNCQDIPGQDLFQFYDDDGTRRDVTSGDVNDYLREISGADFTAKDFRTWAGTVLAAGALQQCGDFETQRQAKKNITRAIAAVAGKLGNTPAVCRKCYIHPFVIDGYSNRKLPRCTVRSSNSNIAVTSHARPLRSLGEDERSVLKFLECCRRETRVKERRLRPKLAKLPPSWRPRANKAAMVR